MKFRFRFDPWQEDEGAEIEMVPCLNVHEKKDMTSEEKFEAYITGYYDFFYFISAQLAKPEQVGKLINQISKYADKEGELVFYREDIWENEAEAWRVVINKDDAKFFKPRRNVENNDHFQQTAIPTELFFALLKEWKNYLESGSQEEVIVDIPFAYDEALYRKTGKIQRKPS